MFGSPRKPEDEDDIKEIQVNEWAKIAGRNELGDMNWGASSEGAEEKEELEETLEKLKEHSGETVLVTGGGGRGISLATLKDAKIVEFMGTGTYKIRAFLKDVRPQISYDSDEFTPILDSWQIAVKVR